MLSCPNCDAHGEDIIGHEVRGVYDGVLFWQCGGCGLAFHRWQGIGYEHRRMAAQPYIDRINLDNAGESE